MIFWATDCIFDMFTVPLPIMVLLPALVDVLLIPLLFDDESRLWSFDPPLLKNPLKKDFLEIPSLIEFITPILPVPDSLECPLVFEFGGGNETLPADNSCPWFFC